MSAFSPPLPPSEATPFRFHRSRTLHSSVTPSTRLATISLAPMMEYTDHNFRYLCRLLSPNLTLFTEMITAMALTHTTEKPMYQRRFLTQSPALLTPPPTSYTTHLTDESTGGGSILQLGGSEPGQLKEAVIIVLRSQRQFGRYTGINLNCGCPSDKVSLKGAFGAVLMNYPKAVGECIKAMIEGENEYRRKNPDPDSPGRTEISVKCRIGVDSKDSYSDLKNFVTTVHDISGCTEFYVHARKAVLDGTFSPLDNRTIPPLKYDFVYQLKRERPDLKIHINGGVNSIKEIVQVVRESEEFGEGGNPPLDGVMVGRGIVSQPWYFSSLDRVIYNDFADNGIDTRRDLIRAYGVHADLEEAYEGSKRGRRRICRPLTTLFNGESHAKWWRQELDKIMNSAGSKRSGYDKKELVSDGSEPKLSELLESALDVMDPKVVDRTREETLEMLLIQDEVTMKAIADGKDIPNSETCAREAIKMWDEERKKMREMEGGESLNPDDTEEDIIRREAHERKTLEVKMSMNKIKDASN